MDFCRIPHHNFLFSFLLPPLLTEVPISPRSWCGPTALRAIPTFPQIFPFIPPEHQFFPALRVLSFAGPSHVPLKYYTVKLFCFPCCSRFKTRHTFFSATFSPTSTGKCLDPFFPPSSPFYFPGEFLPRLKISHFPLTTWLGIVPPPILFSPLLFFPPCFGRCLCCWPCTFFLLTTLHLMFPGCSSPSCP